METGFSELRTKEVVNVTDGRKLGRVCDIVFTYPEGRVLGIVVPGGKGFSFTRSELYIELCQITKIGDDVILVNVRTPPKTTGKKSGRCRPGHEPPQPPCPPACPQPKPYDGRRSYEEYE